MPILCSWSFRKKTHIILHIHRSCMVCEWNDSIGRFHKFQILEIIFVLICFDSGSKSSLNVMSLIIVRVQWRTNISSFIKLFSRTSSVVRKTDSFWKASGADTRQKVICSFLILGVSWRNQNLRNLREPFISILVHIMAFEILLVLIRSGKL